MEYFESRDGWHWKETHLFRPLETMTSGDRVWFLLGHLLLLPLAIISFLLMLLAMPLLKIWNSLTIKNPPKQEMNPVAKHILDNPDVNEAFVIGIRDDAIPWISVVMPFYNREKWVDWAIGSVLRQNIPPGHAIEIIAVDNGSTDGTLERLKRHPIRIIECAERGPGAARNAGIRAARGRIVAFTDSDCVADTEWLMNLVRPFEDPGMLITGGRIESLFQDQRAATFTDDECILSNKRFFTGSAYFPRFFATANAAYRRDALLKVGGFDNSLWMSEDADLAWRTLDLQGGMAYVDDAIVFHQHRDTLRGLFNQAIDYGSASVAIFAKHRNRLGATGAFAWKNLRDIAWSPFALFIDLVAGRTAYKRQRELFYILWRLGFTYGSVRESIRRRVFFL